VDISREADLTAPPSLATAIEVVSKLQAVTAASLHPQVFRGLPAFALDDIEFNLRAFDGGAITGLLYFLNVNEDVPAAVAVLNGKRCAALSTARRMLTALTTMTCVQSTPLTTATIGIR
jgi:hypothetical protein